MIGPPPPVKWTWLQGIFFTIVCGLISFLFTCPKMNWMGVVGCSLFGFLIANLEFTDSPFEAWEEKHGNGISYCFLVLLAISLILIWVHVTSIDFAPMIGGS